jgi:shikimate kinase
MRRIWLVGMMGTGKSSAGKRAAELAGATFHDTDDLAIARSGVAIGTLWEEEGEAAFRQLESEVISELATAEGIVATGGGAVVDPANRGLLSGTVVWLTATPESIVRRTGSGGERPLIAGEGVARRIAELIRERSSAYEAVATHRIDTDQLTVEEVAHEIASLW